MRGTERTVKLVNPLGLHARAAGKLVQRAAEFQATVTVAKGVRQAQADSVLDLMMLMAGSGDELTLKAEGPEAQIALEAVVQLIEDGFGEIPQKTY